MYQRLKTMQSAPWYGDLKTMAVFMELSKKEQAEIVPATFENLDLSWAEITKCLKHLVDSGYLLMWPKGSGYMGRLENWKKEM